MTEKEEIELLRRDYADLRDRVARLEAERGGTAPITQPYIHSPNTWQAPSLKMDCGCPPNTLCMNAPCPRRGIAHGSTTTLGGPSA